MRLIFVIWLVAIMFALSKVRMLLEGDPAGWLARSLGFSLPLFAVYYFVRWARRKWSP